ncbi:signal peptide peptidase SppA [Mesorhizobium sp. CA18]|uniref:signal peptide peptidase SppA n=1 Tax=unclassified Mesorhizobium TaxID=325217 RepID=UPI001CC9509A|nr:MULTISPECIES: signal peptide peptidase SppA [unclassified Mesorhizobium]MBZ9735154.1 signal peptide peptidase SppA [Mesorhizobium sp. CA9]MBZ9828671.1 signal peptide peptidase SppA [Mesorhizobium sp. CA18]MBZ9833073.1 signal peptide peptidase SppA [Mesorhizobium sp. CA2]MBZ9839514.1 signal peptide peptidase SppA [Mesorhizobium sp. CA3]MBZ9879624.1 signal peptide peptidase SppA [Mesorhizobium sp. Ca11]
MAMRADDLIDRRRLRRKLTFWRVVAFLVLAAAIIAFSTWVYDDNFTGRAVPHIAKVKIEGTITEDEELLKRLESIRKSPEVKGVILSIDSPGGTTVGGESTFDAVRKLAGDKPVVAEVGTLAASAGYMIASAADHIVACKTSIVGSIGVLIQYPDVSGLMDKLGIKLEEVKSSPLKASPSPFKPTNDDERAMVRKLILDSYDWFVGIVADRRKMTHEQALALADGSIFTGRQALANHLVDAVGGEQEAIDWLATKGVDSKLKVVEWKDKDRRGGFLFSQSMAKVAAKALGLPDAGGDIIHELGADRLFLDGLVSVWHP